MNRSDCYLANKMTADEMANLTDSQVAILSSLYYYDDCRAENDWHIVHTNKDNFARQSISFDDFVVSDFVVSDRKGLNDGMTICFLLDDLQILGYENRIWFAADNGDIAVSPLADVNAVTEALANFDILPNAEEIKVGDIVGTKQGHLYISIKADKIFTMGKDRNWHSDEDARTEDEDHAVIDSYIEGIDNSDYIVQEIGNVLRLKDNYVVTRYRDKNGNLKENE